MAVGDVTLSNHGAYSISGSDLKNAVDAINLGALQISGQQLFLAPVGEGQVNVFSTVVAGW